MRLLANENLPRLLVDRLRAANHDVTWIRTSAPGATDIEVLALAQRERRVLVTFDRDFGELVYRAGLRGSMGIILLRMAAPRRPAEADQVVAAIASRDDWEGRFAVIDEHRVRIRSLPA